MLRDDGADDVYPPSEDTHLLMDVLAAEGATFGRLGGADCLCLEVGYGRVSALPATSGQRG
jgi:hypothetical protein